MLASLLGRLRLRPARSTKAPAAGRPPTSELEVIKHRLGLQAFAIAALSIALIVAVVVNAQIGFRVVNMAQNLPVRVVPGAAAGVYAPGVTEENVLGAIRYVQGLGGNLTPSTARKRLEEMESYCAPEFRPKFRAEAQRLLSEITAQQQSRSFTRDSDEEFTRDTKGIYTFRVAGPWLFTSGNVVMSQFRHQFSIQFSIGSPDQSNPYGIQLLAFDTVALEPERSNAAPKN